MLKASNRKPGIERHTALFRTKESKEQQISVMEMCITGYGIPLSIFVFLESLFDKMQEICYTRIC